MADIRRLRSFTVLRFLHGQNSLMLEVWLDSYQLYFKIALLHSSATIVSSNALCFIPFNDFHFTIEMPAEYIFHRTMASRNVQSERSFPFTNCEK